MFYCGVKVGDVWSFEVLLHGSLFEAIKLGKNDLHREFETWETSRTSVLKWRQSCNSCCNISYDTQEILPSCGLLIGNTHTS